MATAISRPTSSTRKPGVAPASSTEACTRRCWSKLGSFPIPQGPATEAILSWIGALPGYVASVGHVKGPGPQGQALDRDAAKIRPACILSPSSNMSCCEDTSSPQRASLERTSCLCAECGRERAWTRRQEARTLPAGSRKKDGEQDAGRVHIWIGAWPYWAARQAIVIRE